MSTWMHPYGTEAWRDQENLERIRTALASDPEAHVRMACLNEAEVMTIERALTLEERARCSFTCSVQLHVDGVPMSRYSAEDRERAVELLRCAFDLSQAAWGPASKSPRDMAAEYLGFPDDRVSDPAWHLAACAYIRLDVPFMPQGYLDAAIVLEEGWVPEARGEEIVRSGATVYR